MIAQQTEIKYLSGTGNDHPKAAARTQSVATYPASGGISFLYGIPAIGTKSQKTEDLGTQSQKNLTFANGGLDTFNGVLYFDFRP